MKLPNLFMLLFLLTFGSCLEKSPKDGASSSTTDISPSLSEDKLRKSNSWLEAVSSKDYDEIKAIYNNKAMKIFSSDSIVHGAAHIADYYQNQLSEIVEGKSLFLTEANKKEGIDYELLTYKTKDSDEYVQLVIWRLNNGKKVVEFEYAVKKDILNTDGNNDEISVKRNLWMKLCNAHNAKNLVSELYDPNAIYFNHKPLVIGTEAISKEYQYMDNDTYGLTLEPLKVEMATDDVAFEIGQCKGSYGGKYVIVWKKGAEGKWKVFIDSNF